MIIIQQPVVNPFIEFFEEEKKVLDTTNTQNGSISTRSDHTRISKHKKTCKLKRITKEKKADLISDNNDEYKEAIILKDRATIPFKSDDIKIEIKENNETVSSNCICNSKCGCIIF